MKPVSTQLFHSFSLLLLLSSWHWATLQNLHPIPVISWASFRDKKKQSRHNSGQFGAELLCAFGGDESLENKHIVQWFNQCKLMQVKWPTRQEDVSLWSTQRRHGKSGAISYWCHHPIQSRRNSISLLLPIYRKAMQQSSAASISQHVKMCCEQRSSCGLQRRRAPTSSSFLSSVWLTCCAAFYLSG